LSTIRVANAPCSYGAFELTVGKLPNVPGSEDVLAAMAGAGYEGTELGPPGYLGDRETLGERLERFGLGLAGGFIQIRFSEPEHWGEDRAGMEATLDLLAAADGREARAVLADAGSPARLANLGRPALDRSLGLDTAGWNRLADGVARAVELASARGFEPAFHFHAGTFVEAPWEIERLLELTDVALVLDTGHLLLGSGDPLQGLRDWRDRINHVHAKDVRLDVVRGVVAHGVGMSEAWRRGVFCELGSGDVDLASFFAELVASEYSGWLVVEQDWVPSPNEDLTYPAEAQARNRRWLSDHFGL
jgi:inosose dehydratase